MSLIPQIYTDSTGLVTWFFFCRLMALMELIHFVSWWRQSLALIGKNGIDPAQPLLQRIWNNAERQGRSKCILVFCDFPTLLWLSPSDWTIYSVCAGGVVSSLVIVWCPAHWWAWWLILIFSVSILQVTHNFNLQTDSMMCEIAFLIGLVSPLIFFPHPLGSNTAAFIPIIALRFFTFRMMLSCGLCKWYGSSNWRDCTAMHKHYETQPLPNTLSFWAHHLPRCIQSLTVVVTLFFEIPLCFLALMPWAIARYICASAWFFLLFGINISGNYGYLGLASVALCMTLLDDTLWTDGMKDVIGWNSGISLNEVGWNSGAQNLNEFSWLFILITIAVALHTFLGLCTVFGIGCGGFINSWRLVNCYARFGNLTEYRWELLPEGSDDGGQTWKRYEFKYKVYDINKRPPCIFLYSPRFDWHLWFLPFRYRYAHENSEHSKDYVPNWYKKFLQGLLTNNPRILGLLATNPFPSNPPTHIRTSVYDFEFSESQKCRSRSSILDNNTDAHIGKWWTCKFQGWYGDPVMTLDEKEQLQSISLRIHPPDSFYLNQS